MSLIVRRPHAYRFKEKYPKAPIPGVAILNAKGDWVGAVKMPSETAVEDLVETIAGDRR